MSVWRDDLLCRIGRAETEQAVFAATEDAALALGFPLCAYFISGPLPVTQPKVFSINNYSSTWREHYARCGYFDIDPSIAQCRRCDSPVLWSDTLFASAPQLWADARRHGLRHGWAQGTRACGGPFGMLTLARSEGPITPEERAANGQRMTLLTVIVHDAMVQALAPRLGWTRQQELTDREVETLRWAADGKTTADIADILGLSGNTVKFHIKNATLKLQVANKTAAVAKAALLGLLQ